MAPCGGSVLVRSQFMEASGDEQDGEFSEDPSEERRPRPVGAFNLGFGAFGV